MHLADSTDRWQWSEDVLPALDFCVHALLRDGLRVAPFDHHPDGDRSLRELGLDAEVWRGWVAAVLQQHVLLSQAIAALGQGRRDDARALGAGPATRLLHAPASLCPGTDALRSRLEDIWTDYQPTARAWKESMTVGAGAHRRRGAPTHERPRWDRAQWDALIPYHDRLPTLSVFLVAYLVPAVMAVAHTTCLVAPDGDGRAYARQLVTAAELLVAAA